MNISIKAKKQIRSFAIRNTIGNVYLAAPIKVVDGFVHPHFEGSGYRWETKKGNIVYYPNAYRRAFGKPIYIQSTRHIVVGEDWIIQLEKDILQCQLTQKNKRFVHRAVVDFIFNFGV